MSRKGCRASGAVTPTKASWVHWSLPGGHDSRCCIPHSVELCVRQEDGALLLHTSPSNDLTPGGEEKPTVRHSPSPATPAHVLVWEDQVGGTLIFKVRASALTYRDVTFLG